MVSSGIQESTMTDMLSMGKDLDFAGAGPAVEAFTLYVREIGAYPLLDANKERQLAQRIEAGDNEAREQLITSNLRLVILHAKRMASIARSLKVPDLVQEGNFGLLRAVDAFDYRRGCRFSTYASWWIMRFIMRAIREHDRTVRIPPSSHLVSAKLQNATNDFTKTFGRKPTLPELAQKADISVHRARSVITSRSSEFSIDRLDTDRDGHELDFSHSRFAKHRAELTPEDKTIMHDELRVITRNIRTTLRIIKRGASNKFFASHLSRNYEIFLLRYGIGYDFQPLTLNAIAKKFHLTRERVRLVVCDIWSALRDRGFFGDEELFAAQIARIQSISEYLGDIDLDSIHRYLLDK